MSVELTILGALIGLTTKVAIDAVYYLLRLIRHRGLKNNGIEELIVRNLRNEPSKEAESSAIKLLRAIEDKANSRITEFNIQEVDRLITALDKVVTQKYKEGYELNEKKGRDILEQMRQIDVRYMHKTTNVKRDTFGHFGSMEIPKSSKS